MDAEAGAKNSSSHPQRRQHARHVSLSVRTREGSGGCSYPLRRSSMRRRAGTAVANPGCEPTRSRGIILNRPPLAPLCSNSTSPRT
eukprot:366327-Chlamydomonas_euryale.AAC.2